MLVLTRRVGEEIVIDGDIRVTVLELRGSVVRLGITAPQSVRVLRQELQERQQRQAPLENGLMLAKADRPRPNNSRIMSRMMAAAR